MTDLPLCWYTLSGVMNLAIACGGKRQALFHLRFVHLYSSILTCLGAISEISGTRLVFLYQIPSHLTFARQIRQNVAK